LHQAEDGTWAAYAQWPTKEMWQADRTLDAETNRARQQMREAVEESLPDLYLTVSDDFLVRENNSDPA
jgi:hypothetical protein